MLSHYRLIEKIGEGGMGVVYRAEDTKLRRQVALKVLPPELVGDEERRLRFLREARTAAAVNHPNIAHVYEIDEADGVVFITMELVEGKTLRKQIGGKALPMKDALQIATEMAEALAEAHKARVIHRDLKPDNVIVASSGHAKILDFGLAKLHEDRDDVRRSELSHLETVSGEMTREGKVLGTPAYMSPEQARGKPVDSRSDLFAFGTTLYEMATGSVPFKGKTTTDMLSAIIRDEAIPASQINAEVPPEMERIVGKCLQKDPGERYQHTDELVVDLRHLKRTTDSGVQRIQTPSGPISTQRAPQHRRLGMTVLTGAAAILIATGIAWWLGAFRTPAGFQRGDRVIVAGFEDRAGRGEVVAQIRDAFEHMLARSSFINVVRGENLKELLRNHAGADAARIDHETADRICREGACAGFLIGHVERDGTGYVLTAEMYREGNRSPVLTRSSVAATEDNLLMAIHEMTEDFRRASGEAVLTSTPATTKSLSAYQAYASARAGAFADMRVALARRALDLDPEFVEARIVLAWALWSLGEVRASRQEFERVYQRRAVLSGKRRMRAEINYLRSSYNFDAAFEQLKAYIKLYPSDTYGFTLLCFHYAEGYSADLSLAEAHCRESYRLRPDFVSLDNLNEMLSFQGKADEVESLAKDHILRHGRDESAMNAHLVVSIIRNDESSIRESTDQLMLGSPRARAIAAHHLLGWMLATGRLAEARRQAAAAVRAADEAHDLLRRYWAELVQIWLAMRTGAGAPRLSQDALKPAREGLTTLPGFATFSVESRIEEPLAGLIKEHETFEGESMSRFVREDLDFARGCLALIRGAAQTARTILEPLARNSGLPRRHRMLGRALQHLNLLKEAAREYEQALENPHLRWEPYANFAVPAVQVLEQFRLAQIYDRLGNTDRARHWYKRFTVDWKDADPDIPELIEARKRMVELKGDESSNATVGSTRNAR
jgi:tetratricopeptide (TPR) repeat protein/predicted Ser/Thr protein kinase